MSSNNQKIIVKRNKKIILVASDSESDTDDTVNLVNVERFLESEEPVNQIYQARSEDAPPTGSTRTEYSSSFNDNEKAPSKTETLLTELLKVNTENQTLLKVFVEQQAELINITKDLKEEFQRNNFMNCSNGSVAAKSDEESIETEESDCNANEAGSITKEQHSALMEEKRPSKLVTKAAYMLWGIEELARRSVRFQKNVTERPLSPDKKMKVRRVFKEWMTKNHWPRDTIEDELSRTKMNKYFNGAITAARKRVHYKQDTV